MAEASAESRSRSLTHLRRKTVVSVLRAWREVQGTARHVIGNEEVRASVPKEDLDLLRKQMQDCLNPKGGEVTARAYTVELGSTYFGLNQAGKERFLKLLASEFDIDRTRLDIAVDAYKTAKSSAEKLKRETEIRASLTSPRVTILRQFTSLPNGFKFLVDMRSDLMPLISKDASLKSLDYDFKTIFASWFDVGMLDLAEINWGSPAALLEKLMEYEAVHKIRSWDDLKNRLDDDRKVYAFFHNKMPLEPLIFVQVAFVKGLADNIQTLLDVESPVFDVEEADTAIFYSISNAQKGLAGISFGNFLIKRVVAELSRDYKQIKTFATLSPIPGFRTWLDAKLAAGEGLLTPAETKALKTIADGKAAEHVLLKLLDSEWHSDVEKSSVLKPILMRLCAHYLINEKKDDANPKSGPLDPVSNFHLFNGARLEKLNWLGDTSAKGMKQSAGMMVNYYYKLSEIDENHEEFVTNGKIVASRQVKSYL